MSGTSDREEPDCKEPGNAKRRRTGHATRACNACRRRKAKCDGHHPICSTCALYHEECIFSSDQDGRRPAAKAYVAALEARVKVLEGVLSEAGIDVSDIGTDSHRVVNEANGTDTLSHSPVHVKPGSTGVDRLMIDDDTGELREYGPTSVFKHLPDHTVDSSTQNLGSYQTSYERTADIGKSPPQNFAVSAGNETNDEIFPPGDDMLHSELLRLFFTFFNPWCEWVDEQGFWDDLGSGHDSLVNSLRSRRPRTAYYSPVLHNAILALGVSFLDEERFPRRRRMGEMFIRQAKLLMEDEAERPTLSTVVGLMLMASYYSGGARHGMGFVYAGIGLRLAQTLGLGIDCTHWVSKGVISDRTRQARDRVFYVAYVQDKLWTSYVGRAVSLSIRDQETPIPAVQQEEDLRLWASGMEDMFGTRSAPQSWTSTTFVWTCKLALIAEKVLNTVYNSKLDTSTPAASALASDLNLDLERWHGELPEPLKIYPPAFKQQKHKIHPPHIIVLHIMYQFLQILLHRPWYMKAKAGDDTSTSRCNKAATKILQLLDLFQHCPGLRYAPISLTQMTFTAGTIHLLAAANWRERHPQRVSAGKESVKTCILALEEMGRGFQCASQSSKILQRLLDEWCPVETPRDEDEVVQNTSGDPMPSSAINMKDMLNANPGLAEQLKSLGWAPPAQQTQLPFVPPSSSGLNTMSSMPLPGTMDLTISSPDLSDFSNLNTLQPRPAPDFDLEEFMASLVAPPTDVNATGSFAPLAFPGFLSQSPFFG